MDGSNIILWGIAIVLLMFIYQVAAVLGRLFVIAYNRKNYHKNIKQAEMKLKEKVNVDNFEVVQGMGEQFISNVELIRIKEELNCLSNEQELIKEIEEHARLVRALFSVVLKGKEPDCSLAKNYLNKTIENSLLLPDLLIELESLCSSTSNIREKDVALLLGYLKRINTTLKNLDYFEIAELK